MRTTTNGNTVAHPLINLSLPRRDLLRLVPRSLTKLYSIWLTLTYPFASVGGNVSVHYTCDLLRSRAHRIKLGDSVQINKDAILDVLAPPEQDGEPIIELDDHAQVGYRCLISAKNHVHIERDVIMAQGVAIIDHGYAQEDDPRSTHEPGVTRGGEFISAKAPGLARVPPLCAPGTNWCWVATAWWRPRQSSREAFRRIR